MKCELTFTERCMGGNTFWTWHMKFDGLRSPQICKGKKELNVTTAAVGEILTSVVIKIKCR